jgi:hypothetical protein
MIASDIINRAADQLKDTARVRWTDAFYLRAIGDAQRVIVQMRPGANSSRVVLTLADGSRQTLDAAYFRLLDIAHNFTSTGAVGRAISYCSFEAMQLADPDWQRATKEKTARQWLDDDRDARTYYVYPPASISGAAPTVGALVSTLPVDPTGTGSTLELDTEYQDAVFAYVMFLAYSQEADYANHGQAQSWLGAFSRVMSGKPMFEYKAGPKGTRKAAEQDVADTMGGN